MNPRTRPPNRTSLARPGANPRRPGSTPVVPASSTRSDEATSIATTVAGDGNERVLYTAEQAAGMLQVRPSWLRRKAAARAVPCRFLGKHLRFSRADIQAIADASARLPRPERRRTTVN